jgi:Domain of unknown function (DUF5666)
MTYGQDAPAPNTSEAPTHQQGAGRNREGQNGPPPIFGKITAIQDGTMEVTNPEGKAVTVKLTSATQFRKDRQPAKASDFKVGDLVMVRGDENPDHSVTAKAIGTRSGGGPGGPGGGPGGGGGMMFGGGTLGKDYVMGQVKSIDPPRLTLVRTDNVTQTLELNEDTTLRRGRDSITMADIQVGDHVAARGALENNVFVPKGVMVMNTEQWNRIQEFLSMSHGGKPADSGAPAAKP